MAGVRPGGTSSRRLAPGAIVGVAMAVASTAWACVPGPQFPEDDLRTLIQSCAAPPRSAKVCKPMLDTPPFPEATSVKGPAGSRLIAYVPAGLPAGLYDLVFADKVKLGTGSFCHQPPFTVLSGPVATNPDRGINPMQGTIPTDAPLGGGQVCFVGRASGASLPATFKVNI